MRKYNEEENSYCLPNEYWEIEVVQNEEESDDYEWYYNWEFFISGSLGEVCRYMEWFVYGLDFYKI